MTNTDFSEQWKSMQKMFLLSFPHSESVQENARRFWENQDKILDNMEAFTSNWFKRRHVGTHSAQEAAQRMCGTESVVDMFQAYQDFRADDVRRNCLPGTNRRSNQRTAPTAKPQPMTDELMTAAQAATLKQLAQDAYELDAFKPNLTRPEADKRIAMLTAKLKLLDGPPHTL